MSRCRKGRQRAVSASELAEMGFCEKRILLAHQHGEQQTAVQRRARTRGNAAHQRYFDQGMASATDRRCFVATCVFGPDAAETQVLRAYRDAVLLQSRFGNWAVQVYYRLSPGACRLLERCPVAIAVIRFALRILVWCCRWTDERRGP